MPHSSTLWAHVMRALNTACGAPGIVRKTSSSLAGSPDGSSGCESRRTYLPSSHGETGQPHLFLYVSQHPHNARHNARHNSRICHTVADVAWNKSFYHHDITAHALTCASQYAKREIARCIPSD